MNKVFIGLPTYNRVNYLKKTIESLLNQTSNQFTIFVSDDFSTDSTLQYLEELRDFDNIIIYKHTKNIGLKDNYNFVLNKFKESDYQYFMWAQDDDYYAQDFIKSCLNNLNSDKNLSLAFSNMASIDSYGNVIRFYDDFNRFSSKLKIYRLTKYIFEPEIAGKCNMFLGIYRRNSIININERISFKYILSDYVYSFGILSEGNIGIDKRILFFKRRITAEDNSEILNPIIIKNQFLGVFSIFDYLRFSFEVLKLNNNFFVRFLLANILLIRLVSIISIRFIFINFKIFTKIFRSLK